MLGIEAFSQGQYYFPTDGINNNSLLTRSIDHISTLPPLKNNNSAGVLDSLIYISTHGDRNRIAYYYNDDLSLYYFTNADWYNGEWIISGKHTNTYDSKGNLESVLWEWFNTSSQEWLKDGKEIYAYDSLGNRVFSLHQFFNGEEFVNNYKYDNYFNGTILISSVQQSWIDDSWVNGSKHIYTHTPENLNDTILYQVWTNDQWKNYNLTIYEYDESLNKKTIQRKVWQEQQWIDFAFGQFDYDENNNLILENWQMLASNKWENWFRIFYGYDADNNLIYLFNEEWENDQWIPENGLLMVTNPDGIIHGYLAEVILLYYSKPTSVKSEKIIADGFHLLQNYPNPFNPTTTISYSLPQKTFVKIKVYNLLGEEVTLLKNEEQIAGEYTLEFDAEKLPSGVYIINMNSGSYNKSVKAVLLK